MLFDSKRELCSLWDIPGMLLVPSARSEQQDVILCFEILDEPAAFCRHGTYVFLFRAGHEIHAFLLKPAISLLDAFKTSGAFRHHSHDSRIRLFQNGVRKRIPQSLFNSRHGPQTILPADFVDKTIGEKLPRVGQLRFGMIEKSQHVGNTLFFHFEGFGEVSFNPVIGRLKSRRTFFVV
jgi:hypothetical protein